MDFYRRVGLVCQKIPYGQVATYGQIALLCQKPKNARQVGYALKKNLAGQVPAHRVVGCGGMLSGTEYFTGLGQGQLLREEGVLLKTLNQVDLKRFGWNNTIEEALELEALFQQLGI